MKMYSRKQKVPVSPIVSPTTPVQMGLQSRPFVVQARPVQVSSPDQQKATLQTRLEKAARFGHNLEHIKLSTQPVVQPQQVRRSPENKPAMNPALSNGQSRPGLVQRKIEAAFGTSLSDDRVHKRPEAKPSGALAYTQGSSIHFQPGKYQSITQPNQRLLGHKLTHVVQQRAGQVPMPQSPIAPINADPKLEAEADALGAKAAQGESVQVSGAASSGIQRQPAQGDAMDSDIFKPLDNSNLDLSFDLSPDQVKKEGAITKGWLEGIPDNQPRASKRFFNFSKSKNARKEIADDIKDYEPLSDAAKNMGKGSKAPGYSAENFGINAAEIGESRDADKAVGGLLTLPESSQQVKDAVFGKNKSAKQRISGGAEGVGSLDSTGTYLGIVGQEMYNTAKQGASGAAKIGSQGEGFDAGKGVAGALGVVPKAIKYYDASASAIKDQKYKDLKSWGRGAKNATDLTKTLGGAVKDVSGLAHTVAGNSHNAVAATGAATAGNIAGSFVGPIANTVMGGIDTAQGGYALKKVRNNLKHLEELKPEASRMPAVPLEAAARDAKQERVIKQLEEIQKKKAKRAGLKSALGTTGVAGGVAALAGGPPGLVAGAAIGGGIGAAKIGQWGVRTFKQSMRDKRQKHEDSGENVNWVLSKFNADKSTKKKEERNKNLSADIVSVLDNMSSDDEREKLLSTISLGGSKKDKAAQESYKSALDEHLTKQARASLTPEQQKLLDGAKDKKTEQLTRAEYEAKKAFDDKRKELEEQEKQKDQGNSEKLTWNNIPDELRDAVRRKAIAKTLKKR